MKMIKLLTLTLFCVLVSACNQGAETAVDESTADNAATATDGTVVAIIDGEPITDEIYQVYLDRRTGGGSVALSDIERKQLLSQIVNVNLLAASAREQNLDEQPKWAAQLDIQRTQLLANIAIQHYLDTHPVSEEQLRAEYDRRVTDMPSKEYKARHILLKTEEEAQAVIDELQKGAEFTSLASRSIEPGAAERGGDLGWFLPGQMVEPFAMAVTGMEPGSYTTEPVKTQFGWHVILLEDVRDVPAPAFEDLKPQLETMLQQQTIKNYVTSLNDAANVEIKLETQGVVEDNAVEEADAATAEESTEEPAEMQ
ncbi:MAG TPA: peptidylprolyl isomerase [Gammaproteobacteria bacterium]|nr:peptidylprolyl isomerase [Gammaproteobacteria bacterium]